MKRSLRLFSLALSLTAPALLSAQDAARPVSFGISGGLSIPTGDLGDGADAGYVFAGHVFFKPSAIQALRLRADVSLDRWSLKDVGSSSDASTRSVGVVGNALFDFATNSTSSIKPYVLLGLGLYNTKTTAAESSNGGGSTDVGVQVGGGMEFQLAGFATFAEAKYVNAFSERRVSFIPISFGVRF